MSTPGRVKLDQDVLISVDGALKIFAVQDQDAGLLCDLLSPPRQDQCGEDQPL